MYSDESRISYQVFEMVREYEDTLEADARRQVNDALAMAKRNEADYRKMRELLGQALNKIKKLAEHQGALSEKERQGYIKWADSCYDKMRKLND